MYDPAQREESVPVAVELLRRACLALDEDADVAKRDIRIALELLQDCVVRIPSTGPVQGLAAWQARRVVDHVLVHLEAPIRVEELATVTRLSKSHFSRAFKLSFRMSPHAYIVALRLSRARALLSGSNEQISQIAIACGFADQSHFSRVFQRRAGCPPGLWRREHRSQPINDPATSFGNPAGAQALQHRRFQFLPNEDADDVAA
jgi:AraC family transcriptional regulator